MKLLPEFPPSGPVRQNRKCEVWFSQNERHQIDTRDHLGEILLDLMRIVMDGDKHEFDNEKLGAHIAAKIWHYKKP